MIKDFLTPPYIELAHLFVAPVGWQLAPRQLRGYQLQYCKAGEVEYIIEGQSYEMTPGTLLLIRPHERHEIRSAPEISHICYSFVFHMGTNQTEFESWFGNAHYRGNWYNKPLEKQLSQLAAFYHQPGREHRMKCQSILLDIFAALLQRHRLESDDTNAPINDLARSRMNLVWLHMSQHYRDDVKLAHLEAIAGIGRNHIIRQFRRIYGLTPMQYLTLMRIEEAKSLAVQTSLSVGEIATLVGYSDVHTFGRAFKRVIGVSLSQYCAGMVSQTR